MARMNANGYALNVLSRRVIGCAFNVSNALGAGFPEKVYENGLALEPLAAGLRVEQQHWMRVVFRDQVVGVFYADPLVEQGLFVELKAVSALADGHRPQCVNYLRASGLRLCLLLNFGNPRLEIKRVADHI